jgi:hypothetical protein
VSIILSISEPANTGPRTSDISSTVKAAEAVDEKIIKHEIRMGRVETIE